MRFTPGYLPSFHGRITSQVGGRFPEGGSFDRPAHGGRPSKPGGAGRRQGIAVSRKEDFRIALRERWQLAYRMTFGQGGALLAEQSAESLGDALRA